MSDRKVLSVGLSGYLDMLRFGAAFMVVLSHLAYARFTEGHYGIIRELNLGSDAVVLFFVLSGFVITYAALCKDKTPQRFAFSRLSRLWSVAIPALALTLILDKWGVRSNPDFYLDTPFYNEVGVWEYWWNGLTFSSHWNDNILRLGSNGPYWSLSYEAAYYIAFGLFLYLKGLWRWLALACCILVFGLKILLLAPAWFMGCWLYVLLKRAKPDQFSSVATTLMILVPILLYLAFQSLDVPKILRVLTYSGLGMERFAELGFSDEFIWNALIGALFTIHLFGVGIRLANRTTPLLGQSWAKWWAGGSFSLYLVHYPILQWGGAILPRGESGVLNHVILLGLTILGCYLFAAIFERPLPAYRKLLLRTIQNRTVD